MQPIASFFSLLLLILACGGSGDSTGPGTPPQDVSIAVVEAYPSRTFQRPVGIYTPPDGTRRLFVLEQAGVIRVFPDEAGTSGSEVFLDIRDRVNDGGNEEGLLGMAFHPDFATNGRFYLDYTADGPRRTVVAGFRLDLSEANRGDPASEEIVLEVPQPYANHNGGQIAFGPDGFLYIGLGDGGSGGDPQGNGQNPATLLGSILRIDVDARSAIRGYGIPADNPFAGNGQGYREEIFAYGFRNPWRFSFDPPTGDLWAGDVGQNRIEEIDRVERGGNYGWNTMEGNECYEPSSGCDRAGLVLPVTQYTHQEGNSVTGGFVYRGSGIPALQGRYVYGDFGSGRIWALDASSPADPNPRQILDTNLNIASFGLDPSGELLICAFDGKIYRLVAGG